jgi:hypothetical protein
MELLTPKEAAAFLCVEVETLTKWRWAKTGPSYHRIGGLKKGAIRYSQSDLEDFLSLARVEI